MKLNAQTLREGEVVDCDVCIVGSGPAGIVAARTLAARSMDVVCLESGACESEEWAQRLNDGAFIGAPYAGLRATRHRRVGGTTCIWNTPLGTEIGAKYVPLDPWDLSARADVEHSGWPIDYASLSHFYQRAQSVCGLGPFEYGHERWVDRRKIFPLPDPALRLAVYQFGAASVFTREHVEAFASSPHGRLIHHATACALDIGDSRTVRSVHVATPAGGRFEVRARLVVLAAGAIENARLLLASREPGRRAPGNAGGWLGQGFMEHPRDMSMQLLVDDPEVFARAAFFDRQSMADGTLVAGRIAFAAEALMAHGLPNASVTLLPLLREPRSVGERLRGALRGLGVLRTAQPQPGYGWHTEPLPESAFRGFRLLVNLEQWPRRENRIELDSARDPFGVPKAIAHWQWRGDEQRGLERLRAVICTALEASDVGRLEVKPDVRIDANAHHHAGTTRMHDDPDAGVVDADCRVHGIDNLYVSGSSVFPTSGFANPTLTIVALALRLAERLASRL